MTKRHGNDNARLARVPCFPIQFQMVIEVVQLQGGGEGVGHWPSQGQMLIRVKGQTKP